MSSTLWETGNNRKQHGGRRQRWGVYFFTSVSLSNWEGKNCGRLFGAPASLTSTHLIALCPPMLCFHHCRSQLGLKTTGDHSRVTELYHFPRFPERFEWVSVVFIRRAFTLGMFVFFLIKGISVWNQMYFVSSVLVGTCWDGFSLCYSSVRCQLCIMSEKLCALVNNETEANCSCGDVIKKKKKKKS